jgi:hypothetical protein
MELLQKYFPEDKYVVNNLKNTPEYKSKKQTNILEVYQIKDNNNNNNNCITFTVFINPDNGKQGIYILYLDKCSSSSGTNLLNILEQYAIERGDIYEIDLNDASDIYICNIRISLSYLYLLTTGISWYNKLGYISDDTSSEKEHNLIEIQKNFANNLYRVLTNTSNYPNIYYKLLQLFPDINIEPEPETIFVKIVEKINNIIDPESLEEDPFSLIETFTIQDFFIILHNYIKNQSSQCDNNDVKQNLLLISFLVYIFKEFFTINYNDDILTKEIIKTGGKRKRQNKKSNKKSSKSSKQSSKRSKKKRSSKRK